MIAGILLTKSGQLPFLKGIVRPAHWPVSHSLNAGSNYQFFPQCILYNPLGVFMYGTSFATTLSADAGIEPWTFYLYTVDTKANCRHLKKLPCKGTLRQVFICLRPPSLLGFCLGWCSNFVGSESGQKQSVRLCRIWSPTQLYPVG